MDSLQNRRRFPGGIGPNVFLLGGVSFLNDLSSDMVFSVMPFFIASLGGTGLAVGLVGGLGEGLSGLLKVGSGYCSDRWGRKKPLIFGGYLLSAIVKAVFPFVGSWPALAALVPVERIGKGLRTAPRDAVLAHSASVEARGRAFGIHRALDTAGAFLGALGAFVLFWGLRWDLRAVLATAAVIAFSSLIPLAFVEEPAAASGSGSWKIVPGGLPQSYRRYLLAATVFGLGNFTYMFFILKAKTVFGETFGPRSAIALPILLYVGFNVVYALACIPAGGLADRFGKRNTLAVGYGLYAFTCLGFAGARSPGAFVILFVLYGLAFGLMEGTSRALASDFAAGGAAGTVLGAFHTCTSLAVLPAGIIAGLLWNHDPGLPFIYGAVSGVLAVGLLRRVDAPSPRGAGS